MYILTIPVAIISAYLILHLMNPVFIQVLDLGIGVFLYLLFLNILQSRFRSPITDQQFSQIVASAQDRIVTWRRVSVWQRQSAEPYIASTFNAFFDAVIVSDTMIDLINKIPVSGEALLAFHLLKAPKRRNVKDSVVAILIFFISTVFFTYFFMDILARRFYSLFDFLLIFYVPILVIAPAILMFAARGAFWTHDSAFERASGIYQIHPQVAKDEVMSSQILDEEAAKSTVWVVKEWERKKRSGRQSSITMLTVVFAYILILSIFSFNASMLYYIYTSSLFLVVMAAPLLIALFPYFLLRRWDKKCMGEIYYETTQADEPIWID